MKLYHYTDIVNMENIKNQGLLIGKKNNDTLIINNELLNSNHPHKFDRNQCIFFLPSKPEIKEDQIIIEVDSEDMEQKHLYAANYYYADAIWSRKRYLPDHHHDIAEGVEAYLDSYSLLTETDLDFEEDEIEILYFQSISPSLIKNIHTK